MNKFIESVKVFFRWGFYTVIACLIVSYFLSFNEGFFILMAGGLLTLSRVLMDLFSESSILKISEEEANYDSFPALDEQLKDPTTYAHQEYFEE